MASHAGHVGRGPVFFAPIRREGFLARLGGEMSNLRRTLRLALTGGLVGEYKLDSTRVEYALARALYQNTDDRYKLGSAFARPIVNTAAGFCGAPRFRHPSREATKELEDVFTRWKGRLLQVNRDCFRDGDCYVRLGLVDDPLGGEPVLDMWTVPPEWCEPRRVPLGRVWERFTIRHPVEVVLERDDGVTERLHSTITETVYPDRITYRAPPDARAEIRAVVPPDRDNPYGFIPLVHFRNEGEEGALYGVSDLEPVEPFLRAYHDVALHAIQGSKLFSRPKVKFKLKDVNSFLSTNFTPEQRAAGAVSFAGKELFLMAQDDDAEFISADPGLAGIAQLLEVIFYCVVQVSETPEFAFGAGVASSKGSVAEQQIPLHKKIERKRGQLAVPYAELARMYLAVRARTRGLAPLGLDGAAQGARGEAASTIEVVWDELSAKDEVNTATAIRTTVEAFMLAIKQGVLSLDAAAEHLRTLIPSMLPWDEPGEGMTEKKRVEAGLAFLAKILQELGPPEAERAQGRPPGPSSRPRENTDPGTRRDEERQAA